MSVAAPFGIRNFRFQWPADLVTSWAFEMETLVLGWYILVETGSVLLLTIFGSMLFVGTLFAPMFGVAGDRIGHRNLLCLMRAIYAVLALSLTTAIFLGLLSPLFVLVIAGLSGLVRPSDLATRNALVAETMPMALLAGAVSISRTTMDSARVVGALAGSGLFAIYGMAPTYVVITTLYIIGLALTLAIRPPSQRPASQVAGGDVVQSSSWRDLTAGIAYVWRHEHLQAAMWLAFLVNLTAFPLCSGLMPYVAKEVLHTDQTGLGYLLASFAMGALAGSLILSVAGRRIQPARMFLIFAAAWYVMLLIFARVETPSAGMIVLALAGFAQSLCLVPLVILLMRTSDEKFRGRVMGVRMLAIYSLPVGLLIAGAMIEAIGFAATATLYATTGLVFTGLIALRWHADLWPSNALGNAR